MTEIYYTANTQLCYTKCHENTERPTPDYKLHKKTTYSLVVLVT